MIIPGPNETTVEIALLSVGVCSVRRLACFLRDVIRSVLPGNVNDVVLRRHFRCYLTTHNITYFLTKPLMAKLVKVK